MELEFMVGTIEPHRVVYSWDQMWGRESVTVDGYQVIKSLRIASFSLVHAVDVHVGITEQHLVHIEKRRELLLAGFRPQHITAFVDGWPVATGQTSLSRRQLVSVTIAGVAIGLVAAGVLIGGFVALLVALNHLH